MNKTLKVSTHTVRVTIGGRNWRSKPHPYWFCKWDTTYKMIQSGPIEIFIKVNK